MAKRNVRGGGSAAAPTVAPTPEQVAAINAEAVEAAGRLQLAAQRGCDELKMVLSAVAELLGTQPRAIAAKAPAWMSWSCYGDGSGVRLHHRKQIWWGLSAEASLSINAMHSPFGTFTVSADVNLASNSGSPGEVLARLALHRDTAEKVAQAQMMLTDWLGRRDTNQVKAIFNLFAQALVDLEAELSAAKGQG